MAIPGNLQQHLQIGTENQASNSESLFSAFTKVENNFRDAQYGMNNLTKIITLETT